MLEPGENEIVVLETDGASNGTVLSLDKPQLGRPEEWVFDFFMGAFEKAPKPENFKTLCGCASFRREYDEKMRINFCDFI